ncbi:proline-rich protein 2-like [Neofelis nebulosa]|uniref:proline-rich protein 2-like n=1 Tax=Neofelis nebulosa TaxID=61452 RepID=UPI00272C2E77|nr:proline-rich protein 2-like [Neofelis nebulosa]
MSASKLTVWYQESRASEVAAVVAESLLPQELGAREHARSRRNRPLSALTPEVSVTATTAPGAALHSCLKRHSRRRGCRRPRTASRAWRGPCAPPAPALPQPGPRRGARGESREPRVGGQHGPDTLPRSGPPARSPGARGPANRAPSAPAGPGQAREQPSPPAPPPPPGPPARRAQGAPRPAAARGETVTPEAWGPRQLTGSHLGRLRDAAAPLRPPPLLSLSRRRRRAAPSTNSGLVVGNWKCGSHSSPPPLPPPPPSLPTPPRLRSPAPAPPPPPPRARPTSPQPPSSPCSSRRRSCRRRRGALLLGLARAPDAGERALGREEASPPPGSRAPPLRPRRGGQVEPPSERRQTAPAASGPDGAACARPPLPGLLAPSRNRARKRVGQIQSALFFRAEIAAVIQHLLTGKFQPLFLWGNVSSTTHCIKFWLLIMVSSSSFQVIGVAM